MAFCSQLKRCQSVLAALMLFSVLPASGQTDSLSLSIDSTKVIARRHTSSLRGRISSNVTWDLAVSGGAPKLLGTADPIRFVNMLPGVQTASEFDGGVHILGTDASHNEISIQSVPIYGSNHLFGLFSVFTPSHFKSMEYSPDNTRSERLGGVVNMLLPDSIPEKFSGDFSVGPLFGHGTIRIPFGQKSALYSSVRHSFLNTFYRGRMSLDEGDVRYGFSDCNLTWLYMPDSNDKLWIDGYFGSDKASIYEKFITASLSADWGNSMVSAHWRHDGGDHVMTQSAYFSHYGCYAALDHEIVQLHLPSSISTFGYDFKLDVGGMDFGLDARFHDVTPQYLETEEDPSAGSQHAWELVPSVSYEGEIASSISYVAGLRSLFYLSPEDDFYFLPEPYVEISGMTRSGGNLSLKCCLKRQVLCRTGVSQSALPIEFYYMSGKLSAPQSALSIRTSYDKSLFNDLLSLSASVYCARLFNQVEYTGIIYDVLDPAYAIPDMLRVGRGFNYGLFMMLSKRAGKFTAWAGYAFSRSMRTFDGVNGVERYPSSHDRTHELNIVCDYKTGRFDFGADFVAATGTPFTAPDYFYISSGRVLSHYNSHNANRLEPYVRLDFSADCLLVDKDSRQFGVNLSVYNVLCRQNAMYHRLRVREEGCSYVKNTFLDIRLMPSLSLFYKF